MKIIGFIFDRMITFAGRKKAEMEELMQMVKWIIVFGIIILFAYGLIKYVWGK